jgi:hypothetical protein
VLRAASLAVHAAWSVVFDNPVVGHTRITHPRAPDRIGLVRSVLITREGEWQLSTTVQYENGFCPT